MNLAASGGLVRPRRALISVSDKTGLADFAKCLAGHGVEILSTGGTARHLAESGIEVTAVGDHTGFPELMGGRLKTLHPKIHGGILGREGTDSDEMAAHGISPIDIVAVNLYPFESVSQDPSVSAETVIENIDIGGPAMVRSSAKNHQRTCVVVDTADYGLLIDEINASGGTCIETRRRLALKAYLRTSQYDAAIYAYLLGLTCDSENPKRCPQNLVFHLTRHTQMRYGENPHQNAAFYTSSGDEQGWFASCEMLLGKPLSFNNVADADAAYNCAAEFKQPVCVIIKHATPCGVATAADITQAYSLAYRTDPTSAFGGIIAVNRRLDKKCALAILENQFVEVILAPDVDDEALEALRTKENIRVLKHGENRSGNVQSMRKLTSAGGGVLVQDADVRLTDDEKKRTVTRRKPGVDETADLEFAWKVAKHVKSNAIVYARDGATFGIGAGQMSRVDSAAIAALKASDAGLDLQGAVMASDAFFPFRDAIDTAAAHGIRAIVQPGGSMRDDEVIAAADEHDMSMTFTGMRHFRH